MNTETLTLRWNTDSWIMNKHSTIDICTLRW